MAELDDGLERALLQELLSAYGPCGQEDEVREICRRALQDLVDELSTDAAGNLVALIKGAKPGAASTRILAHLDELSMLVKRIEPDGTLRLTPLGTMYPAN
ncbi:peptidase M42, partial [Mycolicibacterium thermoresistibile]